MGGHRILVLVAIFLAMLAACTSSEGASSEGNDAAGIDAEAPVPNPVGSEPVEDMVAGLLVVPEGGRFGADTLVTCGATGHIFPASALDKREQWADTTIAPEAIAPIEEFLATGEGDFWPQDGYWVLQNDAQAVLLAHVSGERDVTMLGSKFDGASWEPTVIQSGAACAIQVQMPNAFHEVEWRVDRDRLDNDASTIALKATGRACASGQPMGDRLRAPQVLSREDAIYLLLVADRLDGVQTCQGNPEEPVLVELGEPVAGREIIDVRTAAGVISDYLPPSP